MTTEVDLISFDGGDGTGGVDGGVALHQDHPGHVTGGEMSVVRTRRGASPWGGDKPVALKLTGKLLNGGGRKAGKDERRLDGFERGAGGKTRSQKYLTWNTNRLLSHLGRGRLRRRVEHIM